MRSRPAERLAQLGILSRMTTATATRTPCRAPGCAVIPRKPSDPYCSKHKHLIGREDERPRTAKQASRAAVLRERAASSEAEAKAWAAGASGDSTMQSVNRMLSSIDQSTPTSPAGAAEAWQSASALNSNLVEADKQIVANIAETYGVGTYAGTDGAEWMIEARAAKDVWDSEKMLDAVDRTIPADASNAEYVQVLRASTSPDLRPHQIRSLMGGDLEKAYGSVVHGALGIRPLNEETDEVLTEDEAVRKAWSDTYAARASRFSVPDAVPDKAAPVAEQIDALREVNEAREVVRTALEKWTARAVQGAEAGEFLHDTLDTPVGKVTSGLDARTPNHDEINNALAALPDRKTIRSEYTRIAKIKGAKRGLPKRGLKVDDYLKSVPNGHRAKPIAA